MRRCIPMRATDEPASAMPVATASQIVVEVGVEDGAGVDLEQVSRPGRIGVEVEILK